MNTSIFLYLHIFGIRDKVLETYSSFIYLFSISFFTFPILKNYLLSLIRFERNNKNIFVPSGWNVKLSVLAFSFFFSLWKTPVQTNCTDHPFKWHIDVSFPEVNYIPAKLKYISQEKHNASLLGIKCAQVELTPWNYPMPLDWCDYVVMRTIRTGSFCSSNCKINCCQTLEIFGYALLIWKIIRDHVFLK